MIYNSEEIKELSNLDFNKGINIKELKPENIYIVEVLGLNRESKGSLLERCRVIADKFKELNPNIKVILVPVIDGVKAITIKELKEVDE